MLGSEEGEHARPTNREIIVEEFCDHSSPTLQTDRQTDRQRHAAGIPRALCIASRGKN